MDTPSSVIDSAANRRAWGRLATALGFCLVVWTLSCRPTWSPDGKRLTFVARQGERAAMVEYEVEGGTTRFLHELPPDGAAVSAWDEKARRWVVLEAHPSEDTWMAVTTFDASGKVDKRHDVKVGVRNIGTLVGEPVVLDGHLYMMGERAMRVDLESGEDTGAVADVGVTAMFRLGGGVGYVHADPRARSKWEIGRLHPETLAGELLFLQPADCEWHIMPQPAFSPRRDRCAVAAFDGDGQTAPGERNHAILVLADGKVESVLDLGTGLVAGPLCWSPDNTTIYATIVRFGEQHDTYAMIETDFSGAVRREIELLQLPVDEKLQKQGGAQLTSMMALFLQPAVSPDGRWVAFTTAVLPKLPQERHGLLLIDTRDKQRQVKRVPFPEWQ
ncbi:MAG: PD40 domain-containing protein [Planctomycetes bacterium]|nr:PD40 domain-containing protein [Planctomycetota bacterium]